jgi:hypothetical protein
MGTFNKGKSVGKLLKGAPQEIKLMGQGVKAFGSYLGKKIKGFGEGTAFQTAHDATSPLMTPEEQRIAQQKVDAVSGLAGKGPKANNSDIDLTNVPIVSDFIPYKNKKYGGEQWLNKYTTGGDVSIPNLQEGSWMSRYDNGGLITTQTTQYPQGRDNTGTRLRVDVRTKEQALKNRGLKRDAKVVSNADDAKKFMMDYYNSPMFQQLYNNSVASDKAMGLTPSSLHTDLSDIRFGRDHMINNDPNIGGISWFDSQGIPRIDTKNDQLFRPWNDMTTHEVSHQLDYNGEAIPETDKLLMLQNLNFRPQPSHKQLPWWERTKYTPENWENYRQQDLEFQRYVSEPTETLARLRTAKYLGKKNNIYDPFTQKVNKQQYNKIKKVMGDDGYNPIEQLEKIYTPEQIIEMMNKIAKNKNQNSNVAKYGGTTKGWMDGYK